MLKPTRRTKRRYVLIESTLSNYEIVDYVFQHFGVLNFGKLNLLIMEKEGKRIVRVNRDYYYDLLGVFALNKDIKTIKSSGTIKGILKNK